MRLVIANKRYSSWSLRPWLALKTAGIPFRESVIYLRQPDSAARIAKVSPGGKVPVLIDGRVTVWESLAILEYLAEKFPKKQLWPRERAARAAARAVSNEMHAGFQALRQECTMNCVRFYPGFRISDATRADIVRIMEIWRSCRKKYGKGGPFLFGKFSIADAMYAPVVTRFRTYDIETDSVCRKYMEAVTALPAMQEWIADARRETARIEEYEK